ncbi:MAG: VTT domain-containing protein [Acidobacteriota bacterium]|nr:VTT domain-containing protein [Acidobacteriota bacterium]
MLHSFIDFLRSLTDPEQLIRLLSTLLTGWLGYAALCGIVFAETGLLVGFFLPGDSLLFTVGVVCGAGDLNLPLVMVLLMIAAIAGDNTGYWLGRSAGPRIFSRPKSRWFNPDHIRRTKEFYEKHGGKTIVYARFIPIVRTCTPFVAGVAQMPYFRFLSFSLAGGAGWIFFMTMLGYSLGSIPVVRHNFEKVVIAIIVLSLLPALMEFLKSRRRVPSV